MAGCKHAERRLCPIPLAGGANISCLLATVAATIIISDVNSDFYDEIVYVVPLMSV